MLRASTWAHIIAPSREFLLWNGIIGRIVPRNLGRYQLQAAALFLVLSLPLHAQSPCVTPDAPTIIFAPPGGVAVGQTYAVV